MNTNTQTEPETEGWKDEPNLLSIEEAKPLIALGVALELWSFHSDKWETLYVKGDGTADFLDSPNILSRRELLKMRIKPAEV